MFCGLSKVCVVAFVFNLCVELLSLVWVQLRGYELLFISISIHTLYIAIEVIGGPFHPNTGDIVPHYKFQQILFACCRGVGIWLLKLFNQLLYVLPDTGIWSTFPLFHFVDYLVQMSLVSCGEYSQKRDSY